jgi:PAS domain S-box-containing protein
MAPESFEDLRLRNRALQHRVEEAEQALDALRRATAGSVEQRVVERTAEIQAANHRLQTELEARLWIEAELRESEHRFRSIADTAPAGIYITGRDGLLVYVSQWCVTFAGLTREQLAGSGWYRLIHPDDLTHTRETTANAIREQRPIQMEHRMRRFDGEYRWVTDTANPRFVHGEFIGHIGIILDITELKRSQQQALTTQKLESLGVMAAGIAHDFNNLLGTILAHSDLALQEIPSESLAHESVSSIAKVADRASAIVQLLMSYAGHADSVTLMPLELSALIREMSQLMQVSIPHQTSLQLNLAKNLPPIWANSWQIRQVILNLIMNGSEALEDKPGTVSVSTSHIRIRQESAGAETPALPDGDYLLLEVSDTGCGMTEEIKAKIFDPFFSTKFLGRGLGLASTQGIVRSAGGAISVVSSPGQGATFKVWLPCAVLGRAATQ